jgi:azurin
MLKTVCLVTLIALGAAVSESAPPPAARTVNITGTDQLKYSLATITAKPGERLNVVLKTTSNLPKMAMAHNFIILKPGTDTTAFLNASAQAGDHGYIAPAFATKILVSTKLAGAGETVTATFTAPKAPGKYTYLCSFPGHFIAGMKGTLVVK